MGKKGFEIAKALTAVTQASLSVLVPVALFIWLAQFLIRKYALPQYIMIIAIVLGVVSGFYNMMKYLFSAAKNNSKEDK